MRILTGCVWLAVAVSLATSALAQTPTSPSTKQPSHSRMQTTESSTESMNESKLPDAGRMVHLNLSGWTEEKPEGGNAGWLKDRPWKNLTEK